ncbi:DNA processing protein [Staphylococcus aureus]|nr:DNA processing protein [Staphylococcus aureus]
MLNHILLKLIWSRFTTAQIHLLLKTFPSCCEVDEYERMHILENFCKLLAEKNRC